MRDSALRGIHLPESMAHKEMARKRLAFDELFRVQTVLVGRKRAYERDARGIRHELGGELVRRFHAALPYPLTGAQQRVIADRRRPRFARSPCTGSCKATSAPARRSSAVSVARRHQGGHQGALMAPTEVLAERLRDRRARSSPKLTVTIEANLFGGRPLRVELLRESGRRGRATPDPWPGWPTDRSISSSGPMR
ncbi:MAG: hypothetical protein R2705_20160 [Ilumatobacteraceae bacterium]